MTVSQPLSATIERTTDEVLHGRVVDDRYRWLEDQDSPATRAFIQAEQQRFRQYLKTHGRLRSKIERRATELLAVESVDLPIADRAGGLIYLKRGETQEQKSLYRSDRADVEQLLLSVEMLDESPHTSLAIVRVSSNGRYLVFGLRAGGEDLQEIRIYDLAGQILLPDRIPRGLYRGLAFDPSYEGFYYSHEDAAGSYQQRRAIRYHEFGTDHSRDLEIFCAGEGSSIRLILKESEDGSGLGYQVLSLGSVIETQLLFHSFPLRAAPREIIGFDGAVFGIHYWADKVETGSTHLAPRGRVVCIRFDRPEPKLWTSLVAEAAERLCFWEHCERYRVVHYSAGGYMLTRTYTGAGELTRSIDYPSSGTTSIGLFDAFGNRLFYSHSDISEVATISSVDIVTGERRLCWACPSSKGRSTLKVEHKTYLSKDSAAIGITLIRDQNACGPKPTLLVAYGSGGVSITTKSSALTTLLVENGFTCAIAHVRGGGEDGIDWHIAARKQQKQTSVDDLLAASNWLVENGYTTSKHLGVAGHSAGALLVLCAMVQRPESFGAVMALGPLTDLTRFHLFGVARGFLSELGSPDVAEEFPALYRLSPYHNVRPGEEYPATLIISGDRDKRCDALHARKMIARLRNAVSPGHRTFMDYTETRGHKASLALSERIRALSDRVTFLIAELQPEQGAVTP